MTLFTLALIVLGYCLGGFIPTGSRNQVEWARWIAAVVALIAMVLLHHGSTPA